MPKGEKNSSEYAHFQKKSSKPTAEAGPRQIVRTNTYSLNKKAYAAEREAAELQMMQLKQSFCAAEEQESKVQHLP